MKEIQFCETDTNTVKTNIISAYEALAGRTLAKADPIRIFLESIAALIVQQREIIDKSAKENLLYYSDGDYLDHIGYLVGCIRTPAAGAVTTLEITLSAVRPKPVSIPRGTRVGSADGAAVFATDEEAMIPAGETTAVVKASAVNTGAGANGYGVGDISTIIDPIAYVAAMVNLTETEGGADRESDEDYRERIRLAPEHFSVAGPDGAYEYWTKTASALIADVAVTSPQPGEVVIYPLLEGGELPGQEILDKVLETLSDDVRPLTDHVTAEAPSVVSYDVELTYYIGAEDKNTASSVQGAVEAAVNNYVRWQKGKLGRDINPSRLIQMVVAAGAKRVEVIQPVFRTVEANEVAVAETIQTTYGGLEDD